MIGIGERRPLVGVFVAGGGALFGAHVGREKEQRRKGGGRPGDHWYARGRGSSRAAESRAATARLGGSARGQDRRRRAPRRRRGELGPRRPPAGAIELRCGGAASSAPGSPQPELSSSAAAARASSAPGGPDPWWEQAMRVSSVPGQSRWRGRARLPAGLAPGNLELHHGHAPPASELKLCHALRF